MKPNSQDELERAEAVAERARLQQLLEGYDTGRLVHQAATGSRRVTREIDPDRAGKVRARIARLDHIIGAADGKLDHCRLRLHPPRVLSTTKVEPMPAKRTPESVQQRDKRLNENTRKQREDAAAADKAVHEMVKRSIRQHGP